MGRFLAALCALFLCTSATAEELKVLTFNTWHGISAGIFGVKRLQSESEHLRRMHRQIEALRGSNADVIVLQEVHPLEQRAAELRGALADYDLVSMIENCGALWSKVEIGQVILAKKKFNLKKVDELTLLGKLYRDNGCQNFSEVRRALFAEIEFAGKKWLVAGTHLSAGFTVYPDTRAKFEKLFRDLGVADHEKETFFDKMFEAERTRENQVRKIHEKGMRLSGSYAGFFLAADFNSVTGSGAFNFLKQNGYVDLFDGAVTVPEKERFHTTVQDADDEDLPFDVFAWNSELDYGHREKIEKLLLAEKLRPQRIDTIFFKNGGDSSGSAARVSAELLAPESYRDGILSDHFGVRYTLKGL